jgi:predicted SnoaL-like aldol condensation-catalyzing enzyme
MTQALKTVQGIYEAMEQGNVGKVLSVLDDDFIVHLPNLFGGDYRGREGILDVVSKMCSSGSGLKKINRRFVELDENVMVVGNIILTESEKVIHTIPFVDIWRTNENKIIAVQIFYQDPELLADYMKDER